MLIASVFTTALRIGVNGLQTWKVIQTILNKQRRTADKGLTSSFSVGQGLTISYRKNQNVMKLYTGLRTWTEFSERP
jgi:hypothetical protein